LTADHLPNGTQLGSYCIEGLLGTGEMGHVYVARHLLGDRRVALKVLARHLVAKPSIAQRFLREGRAAARIHHENVVEILEVSSAGDSPFIAMQLLEGESLARRFARGPLSIDELISLMLPVIAGVAAAHETGVIHRDLKPHDIFLRRNAQGRIQPTVLNFGMSKLIGEASLPPLDMRASGRNLQLPLPFYLAPEQIHGGRNVRGATDQYSLGVILYEGATGKRPFEAQSLAELVDGITTGKFQPADVAKPGVPRALALVIARAMALQVTNRYTSLWAMGSALLLIGSAADRETWQDIFRRSTGHQLEVTPSHDALRVATTTSVVPETSQAPRATHASDEDAARALPVSRVTGSAKEGARQRAPRLSPIGAVGVGIVAALALGLLVSWMRAGGH
jgi:serine/threonine-protein kinase